MWILSTGKTWHLGDPYMPLTGIRPVDGHTIDLSLSRGELQSQTAMATMTNSLLKASKATDIPVTLIGDDKGVLTKCASPIINKIKCHHASGFTHRV